METDPSEQRGRSAFAVLLKVRRELEERPVPSYVGAARTSKDPVVQLHPAPFPLTDTKLPGTS